MKSNGQWPRQKAETERVLWTEGFRHGGRNFRLHKDGDRKQDKKQGREHSILRTVVLLGLLALPFIALSQETPTAPDLQISQLDRLKVFDKVWETISKNFFDPKFNGTDWPQMRVKYRPLAETASDKEQLNAVI